MRFFRRCSSPGPFVLLALAMQLALALAQTHTHSHAVYSFEQGSGHLAWAPAAGGQSDWAKSLAADFCRKAAKANCGVPAAPHNHHCPTCLAVTLATAGLAQAQPAPPPAPARAALPRPQRAVASLRGADTVHFQARAPPLA